jgi:hypothetical protein
MSRSLVAAILCAAGMAHADPPDVTVSAGGAPVTVGSGPVTAGAGEALRLELRDTIAILQPGATAAFSVDPSVAEASARGGRVTITARSVGSTTISVVTPTSILSLPVVVVSPPGRMAFDLGSASRRWTLLQGYYESSTARLTDSLEMVDGSDERTLRAYAVNVTRLDDNPGSDLDPRSAMPFMSLEWRGPRHELVLLDKTVYHSPLTLNGTTVRGVHARAAGFELHGGVTSPVLYQDVFLSAHREVVLGASYEHKVGRSSFVPSVYGYPSEPLTGGSDGAMGSMLYRYHSWDQRLQLRGELGWGGEFGAAGELSYDGARQRAWISARHQPQGFAGLGVGRLVGSTVDAVWTGQPTDRLSLNASSTAARHEIAEYRQDTQTAMTEARYRLVRGLSASGGASVGRFHGDAAVGTVYSLSTPVGLHLDGQRLGGSAVYRYQRNSARNRGGHGGRLSLRGSLGAVHASTYVDAQQEAATLELILRDQPGLAQALNELGLTADNLEDLARLLRENAALNQLGYVEGASLDFHPWRAQAGGDVAWLAQDEARQQLRLHVLFDRTQMVTRQQDTTSAALSYSRRLTSAIDVMGMLSVWSRGGYMSESLDQWSIGLGARVRIDDVPHLPSRRREKIEGWVVNEGKAEDAAPVAGIVIRLDGSRVAVTEASGRFSFDDVDEGDHRVEAELPEGAYFTGASTVTVAAGGTVQFGLVQARARLSGLVRDDRGAGLGGVVLHLRSGEDTRTATTDSGGRYRFAVAEGEYMLELARESVPAGYDAAATTTRPIRLERDAPARSDIVVPANRSIAGKVHAVAGGAAPGVVTIVELGQNATLDEEGRYVFRQVAPGTYTVEATAGDQTMRRTVEVPAGPASIRDVDFP